MSKSADYAAECLQKELAVMATNDLVYELIHRDGILREDLSANQRAAILTGNTGRTIITGPATILVVKGA